MTCPCEKHSACVPGCALMDYLGYMVSFESVGSERRAQQQQDIMPRSLREQQAAGECCNKTRNVGAPCPVGRECPGQLDDDGWRTAYPEMPSSPSLPDVTRTNRLDAILATPEGGAAFVAGMLAEASIAKAEQSDPAPVPELVQEIDDWYAANDPLMAGAGDGNSPPWTETKLVDRPVLETILEARGERYGRFADNADISQQLKLTMRRHPMSNWETLAGDQAEALDQFACKISRLLVGDPDYVDNWDDIAGYAKLVAERLREEQA